MNCFVLIYDRRLQALLEPHELPAVDREAAKAFHMGAQCKAFHENLDPEIALFQAASREALQRTHGSYSFSERELLNRLRAR